MSSKIFSPIFSKNVAFYKKKLLDEKIFKDSFPTKKVIFIFVARHHLPFKRDLAPGNGFCHFRKRFLPFSQKIQFFFLKKQPLSNKIFRTSFVIKKSYPNFWGKTTPFSKKSSNVPRKQFFAVFSENIASFKKIVE